MYNYYGFRQNANPEIVSYQRGDVNGDGIPDNVYLTGTKSPVGSFYENITLVIQNGMTGTFVSIPLKENTGYNPTLFLGDFTGDRVPDILVSIATGGSGGIMIYYIFSFVNNIATLLFDFEVYNEQYKYEVNYLDNYKAEVISRINNTRYIIDLTYKGTDYLNEIYDKNGKLINPITGFVDPLSGLYPVDFDQNGVYELLAYQKASGRYHADSLGYVLNYLRWENNRFTLFNQEFAINGAEI